jgi:predicted transcriptional regulator
MGVTTVRLQTEIERELDELADTLDRSKGWLINQAVSEYIARHHLEQDRWQQTLEAMESAARGKLVDASEVHEWLSSWGTNQELEAPESGE